VLRFATLFLILTMIGCGGGSAGPATFPVEGTLKVGGKPIADVNVQLIPLDPSKLGGAGKTDATGAFKIIATNGQEGAVVGKYKVILNKSSGMDAAQYSGGAGGAGGPPKVELPFPAEYSTAGTTPKEIEITNKKETLTIEL